MLSFLFSFLFSLLHDYQAFSQWWIKEMKSVKFPAQGSVFDYYLDPHSRRFLPWTDRMPMFEMDPDTPVQVRTGSCIAGSRSLSLM